VTSGLYLKRVIKFRVLTDIR